ncbi:MAG: diphosphomevalonate decarboxylase [Candidatus Aenigmarchaeota archaeon]|nr:diphosphomevalonate decarboxylase [Candidatus Aenigmarchaeota archaeon]
MKASAIAHANIALVKYWGKRNKEVMLPQNGSISMTTNDFHAHTTVEFDPSLQEDILIVNDKEFPKGMEEYDDYVGKFLTVARQLSGKDLKAKIVSKNNFPTAAGLASSAAGFAALATAVNGALGMGLDQKGLSMLARRGSGSATRSIHGGFVEWLRGENEDGSDCFAQQIAPPEHWPEFRMITCITSTKAKKVKSRAGMSQTLKTSPMYKAWLETVNQNLETVRKGILEKNFSLVGSTAEENCIKMHATMLTTKPSIVYWNAGTIELIHAIHNWRDEGLEAYFTIDAGPQVKIICLEKDAEEIVRRVKEFPAIEDVRVVKPGPDARLTEEHLF